MAEVQIKRLSNRHEEILEFMVLNPTMKLRDVALFFEVSQPWLSVLIHSDIFQDKLRERRGDLFLPAAADLRQKMTGMAHLVLDKLGEHLEDDKVTTGQLLEVGDSVLDRLGYGTKPAAGGGPVQNNNFYNVSPGLLSQARDNFGRRQQPTLIEHDEDKDGAQIYNPSCEERSPVRNSDPLRAEPTTRLRPGATEDDGEEERGDEV